TAAPSTSRGVDNFITALRENGWSARHFAPGGSPGTPLAAGEAPSDAAHANVPNVYAELGSVWGSVVGNPTRGSWLLGKLIYYVGPKRVVWGTDALWGGSPQGLDRKSTRLNSSHDQISYAVFCLKKKKKNDKH